MIELGSKFRLGIKTTGTGRGHGLNGRVRPVETAYLMIFQPRSTIVYQTIPNCLVKKFRPKMAVDLQAADLSSAAVEAQKTKNVDVEWNPWTEGKRKCIQKSDGKSKILWRGECREKLNVQQKLSRLIKELKTDELVSFFGNLSWTSKATSDRYSNSHQI